jgi:hypothetical protein
MTLQVGGALPNSRGIVIAGNNAISEVHDVQHEQLDLGKGNPMAVV